MPLLDLTAGHILILACAVFFPPIVIMVFAVLVSSVCGQALGCNRLYVEWLLKVFEWSACQIRLTASKRRKTRETECSETGNFADNFSDSDLKLNAVVDGCANSNEMKDTKCRNIGCRIICRGTSFHSEVDEGAQKSTNIGCGWVTVHDSLHLMKVGMEAVIQDEVTSRFEAEQLMSWNMLTRTSFSFEQFINWKLLLIWAIGFIFRYAILLPIRLMFLLAGLLFMILTTAGIGLLPEGPVKCWLNAKCLICGNQILASSVSAMITFHNCERRAQNGICVANHTSPLDVMILSTDNAYDMVGQRHGGFLGFLQKAISRSSSHIWFERSETKDRLLVSDRLKDHISDSRKLPILIFPEGTCINNTSVMMFKKGCFEVAATVYPIAMKYDSRFGDPFWNSGMHSWFENCFRMLTSWAIICDVWYLDPMAKMPHESAIEFANRVKKEIAKCGGLVDLQWDGELKRKHVPERLILKQQQKYSRRLAQYFSSDRKKPFSTPDIRKLEAIIALGEEQRCMESETISQDVTQSDISFSNNRIPKGDADALLLNRLQRNSSEATLRRRVTSYDREEAAAGTTRTPSFMLNVLSTVS